MAILSHRHRYLFIQVPRTACTAIAEGVLIPHLDGAHALSASVLDSRGKTVVPAKHCTVQQLLEHGFLHPSEASRLFKFCTVRNPFDAMASEYIKERTKYVPLLDDPNSWVYRNGDYAEWMRFAMDHSFTEWLQRLFVPGWRSAIRTRRYARIRGLEPYYHGVDFVMRYENLQADFDRALAHLGLEAIPIPQINRTTERDHSDYRPFYTSRARRIIENVYRDTLDHFGYAF